MAADLNVMMREQAIMGLQTQLDAAVTNGDTAAARKISDDIAKLAVSTAPKAPPFTPQDVYAQLETKAPWYGVDPKKSAKAEELGKAMKLSKFPTADAFATALIAAVEDEFKPASKTGGEPDGDTDDAGEPDGDAGNEETPPARKPRRTDGPGDADTLARGAANRRSGPWTKLSDAPADVQKEINRTADKLVSSSASKEQRANFITKALEGHYAQHQRKGKK